MFPSRFRTRFSSSRSSLSRRLHHSHRTIEGFTLVELLVAVAIIGVLAALALPAYNNYATKSRFTEVVSATNPIKTYVSSCAADGSCIQNNQIYLDLNSPSVMISAGTPDQLNIPSNEQSFYMNLYQAYQNLLSAGYTPQVSFADEWAAIESGISSGQYTQGVPPSTQTPAPTNVCIYYQRFASGRYTPTCIQIATTSSGPAGTIQFPTSIDPSSIPSYSSINGYVAPTYQAAHVGTTTAPCVSSSDSTCKPSTKYVLSAAAISTGVITATAQSSYQLNSNTFILIPSYSSGRVDWTTSGSCKSAGSGSTGSGRLC